MGGNLGNVEEWMKKRIHKMGQKMNKEIQLGVKHTMGTFKNEYGRDEFKETFHAGKKSAPY